MFVDLLKKSFCGLADVVAIFMYVSDMSNYSVVNEVYMTFFFNNPPVRYLRCFLCYFMYLLFHMVIPQGAVSALIEPWLLLC